MAARESPNICDFALFQILRLTQEEGADTATGPVHVIEALMLNSNRDHISAIASDTGKDRHSRNLFRVIIMIQRSMICAQRAESYGLSTDADSYQEIVLQNRAALEELTDAVAPFPFR
jgi:hypothetical protein